MRRRGKLEVRRKKEEGRRKKEEGRRKKEEVGSLCGSVRGTVDARVAAKYMS